jgi:hypothetical protein
VGLRKDVAVSGVYVCVTVIVSVKGCVVAIGDLLKELITD